MSRVERLSDGEYKVIGAIRDMVTDVENQRTSSAVMHQRAELESIYHDLTNISGAFWEDELPEITRRLYALLH
jgi:hypothetical protein